MFKNILERVDTLAKPDPDQLISKVNADENNNFKIYIKRIEIFNKKVISNNKFYAMCMKELHHKVCRP